MRSLFRPAKAPDTAILDNHRAAVRLLQRRGVLSLGALTMLTGCDPESNDSIQSALRAVSGFNDRVQALLLDPDKLAPTSSIPSFRHGNCCAERAGG